MIVIPVLSPVERIRTVASSTPVSSSAIASSGGDRSKLTVQELATKAGGAKATVSNIEAGAGARGIPSVG